MSTIESPVWSQPLRLAALASAGLAAAWVSYLVVWLMIIMDPASSTAGLGILIGTVFGVPALIGLTLVLVGYSVRSWLPRASRGIAIAGVALVGLLAALLAVMWITALFA